jgi:hypothetical protein
MHFPANTSTSGAGGCFGVPSNPSKSEVLSLINLTQKGEQESSKCAEAAIRFYQSANVLDGYNISINITALADNITVNGTGVYH